MSTSRAKQIAQKRKTKTKKKGNGAKYAYAKKKKMSNKLNILVRQSRKR